MRGRRRPSSAIATSARAPGRSAQALGIELSQSGADALREPFTLLAAPAPAPRIVAGPGSGSRRPPSYPWRYCLAGSPFLSPGGLSGGPRGRCRRRRCRRPRSPGRRAAPAPARARASGAGAARRGRRRRRGGLASSAPRRCRCSSVSVVSVLSPLGRVATGLQAVPGGDDLVPDQGRDRAAVDGEAAELRLHRRRPVRVADPDGDGDVLVGADEPGIGIVVGRAGLAPDVVVADLGALAGAAGDDGVEDVGRRLRDGGVDDLSETFSFSPLPPRLSGTGLSSSSATLSIATGPLPLPWLASVPLILAPPLASVL